MKFLKRNRKLFLNKNTFEKYQNIFNIYFQQILFVQSKVIVKKYVRKVSFITFG